MPEFFNYSSSENYYIFLSAFANGFSCD